MMDAQLEKSLPKVKFHIAIMSHLVSSKKVESKKLEAEIFIFTVLLSHYVYSAERACQAF